MSFPYISLWSHLEQAERPERCSDPKFSPGPAVAQICIELFTRAGLYAAVIGLIAAIGAALLPAN